MFTYCFYSRMLHPAKIDFLHFDRFLCRFCKGALNILLPKGKSDIDPHSQKCVQNE